ncbi:hypothetical protein BGZ47_007202 [Haplosporangium gracile]|nr:hypothetical protein BGZ47_007202 [Haplosporangium gracile]
MAISINIPMFDMTDSKLSKSADSLESALAQFGKNATPLAGDNYNLINATAAVSNNGSGFDEWLASDFQLGALSGDDSSLSSSPYTALDDSPLLGFESFGSAMNPSLFDMPLGLSAEELVAASPVIPTATTVAPVVPASPIVALPPVKVPPMLTTAAVQQAAIALNIPWSHDLELAVMAQAANHATTILPSVPTPATAAASIVVPKIEPVEQSYVLSSTVNKKRAASPSEESEEVIAKRAKNTDAARRSRLKKLVKLEGLEVKVSELEADKTRLTMRVAVLETEKTAHLVREAEQNARIAQLEAKLAEAHAALTAPTEQAKQVMQQEENALDLPEIRSIIGTYLTRQDLIHSSKVSHAWQQSFEPLIWRETILRSSQNPNRATYLPPPPLAVFREHGHLIRTLSLEGPVSVEEVRLAVSGCRKLEYLRLSATVPGVQGSHHHGHGSAATNNHNNNGRQNNDENAGPSNPGSTAGRWNLLLLAEGGDEANGGDDGSDSDGDSGSNQDRNDDNNDDGVTIVGLDGGGESSDDSFWSDWNRSEDEDEDEFVDESENNPIGHSRTNKGGGGGRFDMWKSLAELVVQNRATLKELEIVLLLPPPYGIPHVSFWEAVVDSFPPPLSYSSSTLTSLSLVGREIRSLDLMLIWRAACPHLTSLELARCNVETEAPLWGESVAEITETAAMVMETESRPPCALRYLKLMEVRGMMPRTQFKVFIADSPRLKSLVWQLHRSHAGLAPRDLWVTTEDDFWQDYRGQNRDEPLQQWLDLTSLELTSSKESLAVSDQQLAILLDRASDTMERLVLGAVRVGEATLRSMRRFFDSVVELDLRLCSDVTGAMVQQVLASCLGLKFVAADSIHASDILDGDPWVCLGLQSWAIFVDLSVTSSSWPSNSSSSSGSRSQGSGRQRAHNRRQAQKGKIKANDKNSSNSHENQQDELQQLLQQCVFERLSLLTRLEHLDLDRHHPLTGRAALKAVETLDWRLRKGLDKLVTLTRLTTVCLSSHQTMNMSKSAAVWMIEHWLQLEVVRGRLGERKGDHKELARLFSRNRIQVD